MKKTPWFSSSAPPVRVGVYQTRTERGRKKVKRLWDGADWRVELTGGHWAHSFFGWTLNGEWRGLTPKDGKMSITTLNKIRAHKPCEDGWRKLLKHLGKTSPDDQPLSLLTILDSNGLNDALWCLRAMPEHDRHWRLYAVWCARQVQHLMKDPRSIAALDIAERHANGQATDQELDAARDAAWNAARDAAGVPARAAAWNAARDAAGVAARGAAGVAAWVAARAVAWNAARAVAGVPARNAARDAAGDAALAAQAARLREVCAEIDAQVTV